MSEAQDPASSSGSESGESEEKDPSKKFEGVDASTLSMASREMLCYWAVQARKHLKARRKNEQILRQQQAAAAEDTEDGSSAESGL